MHAVLCQPISWLAIHEKTKSVHPMLIKFCAELHGIWNQLNSKANR